MGTAAVCAGAITHGSIAGGFLRVEVASLLAAWRATVGRPGGAGDFRAWLAAREMAARRGVTAAALRRTPRFDVAELAALCGSSPRRARDAVRRLEAAGLIARAEHAIGFPPAPAATGPDPAGDSIGGGRDSIAIPRRLLRHLVTTHARPALLAAALAALLRCVSRRRDGWRGRGRIKASWAAAVFGVGPRAVKAARAELVALGWLVPEQVADPAREQRGWNRWGRAYRVDLAWAAPRRGVAHRHPSPADPCAGSPPPLLDPEPLRGRSNPEPGGPGPAGASLGQGRGNLPAPDLRDIRDEDLVETARALELHRQAVARGRISASEADRVRFLAAVEHARAVGRSNPPGLLARVVAKGWWHLASQRDEDRASGRLRRHDRPCPMPAASRPGKPPASGPLRSPYAQAEPRGEPSALGDVLARLASGQLGRVAPIRAGRPDADRDLRDRPGLPNRPSSALDA